MQTPVFVLMDDAPPVAQFEVRFPKPAEVGDEDAISLHLFERLDELLTHLIVIKLVHAEHDASVARKGRGDFLAIHQPIRTGHPLLDEVGILAIDALAHQQVALGETARGHTSLQLTDGFIRKRTQRFHPIHHDFHKHQHFLTRKDNDFFREIYLMMLHLSSLTSQPNLGFRQFGKHPHNGIR